MIQDFRVKTGWGDRHFTEPMKVLIYFDLKQWNKKRTISSLGHIFDDNGRYNQIPLLACDKFLGCLPPSPKFSKMLKNSLCFVSCRYSK